MRNQQSIQRGGDALMTTSFKAPIFFHKMKPFYERKSGYEDDMFDEEEDDSGFDRPGGIKLIK